MAIFVIGDLHLSLGTSKPMDIFRGWDNYVERLTENWRKNITDADTVVLAGDTSWGMKLEECVADFAFLEQLPGQKILIKGNHDYWWTTLSKMNAFVAQQGFTTLHFMNNNSYTVEGVSICGTRSWLFDVGEAHNEKVMNREKGRLIASLQSAEMKEKIVVLHYPPVYATAQSDEMIAVMQEYGVKTCYYGHLHGNALRYAIQGDVDGIVYRLASADGINFCPLKF